MGSFEKPWETSIVFALRFLIELLGAALSGLVVGLRVPPLTFPRSIAPTLLGGFVIGALAFSLMLLAEWMSTKEEWWRIAAILKSASVGGLCLLSGISVATLVPNRRG